MYREPGSGATSSQSPERKPRWTALATILAGGLLLAPAVAQAFPARLPLAQQETAGTATTPGNQVIAQGISRLPKGEVAWTVRRFEVPGDDGAAVETFPLGFVLADGAEIALLDDGGGVLGLLDHGEAAFLPNGKAGALAGWPDDPGSLFELALVSGEDAAAGTTAGTVVGGPFAAPDGRTFEIELSREALADAEEATIPASRSGTPVLFLLTSGTAQLTPPGGQPVELAAGQYALLAGEVVARGVGADRATFVVAAIGESTGARGAGADGTPEARAGRANRDRNRDRAARGGGGGGGGGQASNSADKAARKAARQAAKQAAAQQGGGGGTSREERQANRANRQNGTGGQGQQNGGAPVTEGTPPAGTPPAGTPPPVDEQQDATPEVTAIPGDGTPTPAVTPPTTDATPPADDDEVIQGDTPADDDEVNQDDTDVDQDDSEVVQDDTDVVQDDTEVNQDDAADNDVTESEQASGEQAAPDEETPALAPTAVPGSEAILPVEEVPAEVVPAEDVPVEQAPVEEVPVEQAPVEEVPAGEVPVEQAPVE